MTDTELPSDALPDPVAGPPSGAGLNAVPAPPRDAGMEALVAAHQAGMLRYALHLLGRGTAGAAADAQDVVQDAFLRLHRQREAAGAEPIADPKAWLMRVTHNGAMDVIRKRTTRRAADQKLEQDAMHELAKQQREPAAELMELEHKEAAQHAIDLMHQLPDNQQRVVLLRLQDMTVRQIAEVLNMTPGNVGYHLNQGMATLARQLKQADMI